MSRYKPNIKKCNGSINRSGLYKGKPIKSLTNTIKNKGGRNNLGRITCHSKGSRGKRKYRLIDFLRNKDDLYGTVQRLEYDPNRTAFIALITYEDNKLSYILAPEGLKVGDRVISGNKTDVRIGNAMRLENIPDGTIIHNVELTPGKGGVIGRSAGSAIKLAGKEGGFAALELQSREIRRVPLESRATIGMVSNPNHKNDTLGKAGKSRHKGIAPRSRGIAKNPVDHPHGGRSNTPNVSRNHTGRVVKGKITRLRNKKSNNMIIRNKRW